MSKCETVNCQDSAAKEGRCGYCYNVLQEYDQRKIADVSPAQLKKMETYMKELDEFAMEEMIDLSWWFSQYGETEMPAKFMNKEFLQLMMWDGEEDPEQHLVMGANLSKNESRILNEKLKALDGEKVNETHVWRFTGKKHYRREGTHNHFRCEPISE